MTNIIRNFYRQISVDNNWNIGFANISSEEFIKSPNLIYDIHWLKHDFRDRFFADPFILNASDEFITVLCEEFIYRKDRGTIVELKIDSNSYKLIERYEALSLDTHLSYPAIYRNGNQIFVYPENGESGVLKMYEYESSLHKLINPKIILNEPVADATIIKTSEGWLLSATKFNDRTNEAAYIYFSSSYDGPYELINESPYVQGISNSRMAGNFISIGKDVYRPVQDCKNRYGSAINILKFKFATNKINEDFFCRINPIDKNHSLGIHTVNFHYDLCVFDGYDYLYKRIGPITQRIRHMFK